MGPIKIPQRITQVIDSRVAAVAAIPPPPVFLSIQKLLALSVAMQSAFCISLGAHLLVLLGIGFSNFDAIKFTPPPNALDVVLVNSKTKQKPTKADALAQANLDGGGNTDEKRIAKSMMPAIEQHAASAKQSPEDRVKALEQEMKQLLAQVKSDTKVPQGDIKQPPPGQKAPVDASDLMQKSIEMEKLEAQISREYEAYQQRPKRTFIGARTSEYRFAQYVDNWRLKIERVGNLNYPEEAKARGIYGALQLTVAIKANGEVEDIQVNRSSGSKILDQAALRIVRLAAPFDRFPDNIKRDTDILHITRTWMFTKGGDLVSEK